MDILKFYEFEFVGANDAVNMVSMLSESSLNFKYSTLEKATGSFDIANKLGQGGFGTVYKVSTDTCAEENIFLKPLFGNAPTRCI